MRDEIKKQIDEMGDKAASEGMLRVHYKTGACFGYSLAQSEIEDKQNEIEQLKEQLKDVEQLLRDAYKGMRNSY